MDLISYILFPSKQICQGKPFKRYAELSASPPLIMAGKETIELIAINCNSCNEIPATVNSIASKALEQPLTEENLANALWSDTCARQMHFKPFGNIKPEYLEEMFQKQNINLKCESCIYIQFEKETLDIVTRFTENKLKKNLQ